MIKDEMKALIVKCYIIGAIFMIAILVYVLMSDAFKQGFIRNNYYVSKEISSECGSGFIKKCTIRYYKNDYDYCTVNGLYIKPAEENVKVYYFNNSLKDCSTRRVKGEVIYKNPVFSMIMFLLIVLIIVAKRGFALLEKYEKKIEYIDCSNKKILIVDDNLLNIKHISKELNKYNFIIESVTSGEESITLVKNNNYDLVFLDSIMPMPNLVGDDTLEEYKKLDIILPPIISMTSIPGDEVKEESLKKGYTHHLKKPINFYELNEIILEHFKVD